MYIIDYKTKTVAKFNKKELSNFLNHSYKKNRFIFVDNKQQAKQVIKHAIQLTNQTELN
jgi:ribosomal protein S2